MNLSPEMIAWNNCALEDLWIFDKLIVAKKAVIYVDRVEHLYQVPETTL